jgi:large subunit ribosomal protein L17
MRSLGRKKSNREHLVRNLATSLVLWETIDTTEAKAKETKTYVEKLLARNKTNDLTDKRAIFAKLFDKNASDKVIKELFPRYSGRNSGFIRSYHLKNRLGDNAPMMRLELVDKKVFVTEGVETKLKKTKTVAKETEKKS